MKQKKRKVVIVTGGRIEYGYTRPVIREIQKRSDMDYKIIAANMHLLDDFGRTIEDIKKDQFHVDFAVHNTLDGYNHITMVKSLGVFLLQLPELIENLKPDFIIVAGDRGEQLIGAMVGAHMYIPVAHIQAGELSGNIDGTTRHAITKFAHIHFAANQDSAERLRKMGEEPYRIFNVGAPQLDDLLNGKITPPLQLRKKLRLNLSGPLFLVIQHSVTEEAYLAGQHMAETMKAVTKFPYETVIILNNSDTASNQIRDSIMQYRTASTHIFQHVPRQDYAGLMKIASVLVGNSSSGILEAPSFHLPAINIGRRQIGRLQGANVINAGYNAEEITSAIKKAMGSGFRKMAQKSSNPYGDGKSAKRIVDILSSIPIDEKLLIKRLTY